MDNEQLELILMDLEERLDKTLSVLKGDFQAIRAGRANPHVLDKITVDYYGEATPINQTSNISVQEGRCLVISPWDSSLLKGIEKAILKSDIGINPINDGKVVRLVFPELTEERRRELGKKVRKMGEDAKVASRNIRRDAMDAVKKLQKSKDISEDEQTLCEKEIEKLVSSSITKIESEVSLKEKDLMKV